MSFAGAIRSAPSSIADRAVAGAKRAGQALEPVRVFWARVALPLVAPGIAVITRVLRVVTPFGWVLLSASVVAWIVGQRLGWHEFTALAVVGFVMLAAAVPFVLGRSVYSIDLGLAESRVVVGERAVGRVTVTNAFRRPLLPARIELPVGRGLAAFHLPRLAPGAIHEDLFSIPTGRRMVLRVGPVRSVRGDALGLCRLEVAWTAAVDLYVHPRTVRLENASSGFLRDLEGLPTKDLANDDVAFHALREYVPGDDLRNVHWRSSARTAKIMVRQFEETRRSHLAIVLSRNPADYADAEQFELAVSVCGSLGVQALLEEKQLTIRAQELSLPTNSPRRLLDGLSAVEQQDSRDGLVQLARHVGNTVPNASIVVLLFGGTVAPAAIRAAAMLIPHGVRVIAVSCVPGEALARRAIGDTTVLTVGDLAELPLGIRRVTE
ncbi:DUF58 domain-containing protein [Cryobacterium roopkundense]|uniref:Uncharacterized protein (DUF58 family) n=1 Tax=Cryobacterium roopkundense TaxID=1001240 RepID=A0A7W8ZYC0_9MICO|nr:DUF58 domain-containing protein [Cryobacterium roopkundense]MBB5642499.1 uncharacterized protein (DUF58 family) [Cryobacterium roopkundense]